MKLKPITKHQLRQLQEAEQHAAHAQKLLRIAGADKAAAALARARKSIGGAIRHGQRRPVTA